GRAAGSGRSPGPVSSWSPGRFVPIRRASRARERCRRRLAPSRPGRRRTPAPSCRYDACCSCRSSAATTTHTTHAWLPLSVCRSARAGLAAARPLCVCRSARRPRRHAAALPGPLSRVTTIGRPHRPAGSPGAGECEAGGDESVLPPLHAGCLHPAQLVLEFLDLVAEPRGDLELQLGGGGMASGG